MTTPQRRPTTALLAPVPVEVLRAMLDHEDNVFVTSVLVQGDRLHHALVNYEPGSPHDERDVEAARELSARCDGAVYLVSFGEDDERVTTCQRGAVTADMESDDAADPDKLARELGLGGIFPPGASGSRSFMYVQNSSVDAVEGAMSATLKRTGKVLRLEPRGAAILGWIENQTLGSLPEVASRKLRARVFHSLERRESFAVLVTESGKHIGIFESPRTTFSEGFERIDSILGETTREGILRAMGVDAPDQTAPEYRPPSV